MFRDIVRDQDFFRQLCIGRRHKEDLAIEAQLANDPGGNRWSRHLNRLVDLYLDDAITGSKRK